MRYAPKYFFRGSYAAHPKAGRGERMLQILRILNKNNPKWTKPATVSKEIGIMITNAQNLLTFYKKRGLVEPRLTKLGKYELAVYRLTDHGRYELQQLEREFVGKIV